MSDSTRASIRYDVINIDSLKQNPYVQPSVDSNNGTPRKRESILNNEDINEDSKYHASFLNENQCNNSSQNKCMIENLDVTEIMPDVKKYYNNNDEQIPGISDIQIRYVNSSNKSLIDSNSMVQLLSKNDEQKTNNLNSLMDLFYSNNDNVKQSNHSSSLMDLFNINDDNNNDNKNNNKNNNNNNNNNNDNNINMNIDENKNKKMNKNVHKSNSSNNPNLSANKPNAIDNINNLINNELRNEILNMKNDKDHCTIIIDGNTNKERSLEDLDTL